MKDWIVFVLRGQKVYQRTDFLFSGSALAFGASKDIFRSYYGVSYCSY